MKTDNHDDDISSHGKEPSTPSTPSAICKVVVYTPSKTWPATTYGNLEETVTETSNDEPNIDLDDVERGSVFSMTEYGSLDWDHSGDDFENVVVTPKPKRRLSFVSSNFNSEIQETKLICPEKEKGSTPVETSRITRSASKAKGPPIKSPYFTPPASPSKKGKDQTLKEDEEVSGREKTPSPPKSTPKKRAPGGVTSCIPFPPLSAPHFGLIQERLASDPFHLLIAVTFLNRTHGKYAIPVFYELMEQYPSPESLIAANKDDIILIIRHLGLQNQRAGTYQTYAKIWLENPPVKGRRYTVRDYPTKGAGRDIKNGEVLDDEDPRKAWEIGHMTRGPYAIDSWRIFCRDVLRGVAKGWNGEGNEEEGFQPEWMRVLPKDKELRAYLRWMWLKEGFEWNPFTGDKEVASQGLMKAAIEGRIAWDDQGGMRILDEEGERCLN